MKTVPPGDLRLAMIGLPGNVLHSYLFHYAMADSTITHVDWWRRVYRKDGPNESDRQALLNLESEMKHTTLVFFLSRVEWNFRKLVTFSFPRACRNGGAAFKVIYDYLLKRLHCDSYIPLYDLARHIRNSVHSNGIFISNTGKDETAAWKGRSYEFRHLELIEGFRDDDMLRLCSEVVDSIEAILTAPPVKSAAFIEDRLHRV
jgi:hypothetical protein